MKPDICFRRMMIFFSSINILTVASFGQKLSEILTQSEELRLEISLEFMTPWTAKFSIILFEFLRTHQKVFVKSIGCCPGRVRCRCFKASFTLALVANYPDLYSIVWQIVKCYATFTSKYSSKLDSSCRRMKSMCSFLNGMFKKNSTCQRQDTFTIKIICYLNFWIILIFFGVKSGKSILRQLTCERINPINTSMV